MRTPTDLMLILETDPESLAVLHSVAQRLGCDRVEVESLGSVDEILAVRHPTLAVLAIDRIEASGLAVLRALAERPIRPAVFLIGSLDARVLGTLKRAAAARGLQVIGTFSRPLDAVQLEQLMTAYLTAPPPIPREELEQALSLGELTLEYQPKMALSCDEMRIQGVEALVRWRHPRRGLLYPRHFLPAVEAYDLFSRVTDFVMGEAIRQAGQWRTHDLPLEMVVNLSPGLVRDRDFPERLACLLREHEVPADQLVLDVTEATPAIDRDLMLDVFTRLRIQGIGLSLDNFGTGLSSLTELYRMPYSEIKVDHSLIADVTREPEARLIVEAIVKLAHTLQLAVCAAGVETRQMLDFARQRGIDTAQGRFFSGPVAASEVERIASAWPVFVPGATGTWRPVQSADPDPRAPDLRRFQPVAALGKPR
jgi:EAL domain-containing protein (putative c-di-GMP-specific phosphodiesterase class I)